MMLKMTALDLYGKRVLIREDFNVPMQGGIISNDQRIRAAVPSIKTALNRGGMVLLMSHLGRPASGKVTPEFSLAPVAKRLSELLKFPVRFVKDWLGGVPGSPGEVILLENVRFLAGELENDPELGKAMAKQCDVFVMDAFGTAHRAHASTHSVAEHAPIACAGPLLTAELAALESGLKNPQGPVVAVVGGAKVSSKLPVLRSLLPQVDTLILGGGIANNIIASAGFSIGTSLFEPELADVTSQLIRDAVAHDVEIPFPLDVVCSTDFSGKAQARLRSIHDIGPREMILDIGQTTSTTYSDILSEAGTIIWNGPVGAFEFKQFAQGTMSLARSIARSSAYSIAGGGDTIAAIETCGVWDDISYISTGGGAFLEFLEGKPLAAVRVLKSRAA